MESAEIWKIWVGGGLFCLTVLIVSVTLCAIYGLYKLLLEHVQDHTRTQCGCIFGVAWCNSLTSKSPPPPKEILNEKRPGVISADTENKKENKKEHREQSAQNESDASAYNKVFHQEPKSDLWRPNEPKRTYEPRVVPQPSTGSRLDVLKDVQIAQVQVLKNIQKGLQELRNELKDTGIQNESLFDNLNQELYDLRERDVSVNVTRMESGKFRHWKETRRYH